jgi:hypothetical protein
MNWEREAIETSAICLEKLSSSRKSHSPESCGVPNIDRCISLLGTAVTSVDKGDQVDGRRFNYPWAL